jgi:hypothetical protein
MVILNVNNENISLDELKIYKKWKPIIDAEKFQKNKEILCIYGEYLNIKNDIDAKLVKYNIYILSKLNLENKKIFIKDNGDDCIYYTISIELDKIDQKSVVVGSLNELDYDFNGCKLNNVAKNIEDSVTNAELKMIDSISESINNMLKLNNNIYINKLLSKINYEKNKIIGYFSVYVND